VVKAPGTDLPPVTFAAHISVQIQSLAKSTHIVVGFNGLGDPSMNSHRGLGWNIIKEIIHETALSGMEGRFVVKGETNLIYLSI